MHTDEIRVPSIIKTIKEGLTGYGVGPYTPLRVKAAKSLKNITKALRKYYDPHGPTRSAWLKPEAPGKPLAG